MNNMVTIILSIIFIIFILSIAVGFMELCVPIIVKADFDRVCSSYVDRAVANGGLTTAEINSLTDDIEAINNDITVNGTDISLVGSVAYKDDIAFIVDATYVKSTIVNIFVRNNKTYNFYFSKNFVNTFIIE